MNSTHPKPVARTHEWARARSPTAIESLRQFRARTLDFWLPSPCLQCGDLPRCQRGISSLNDLELCPRCSSRITFHHRSRCRHCALRPPTRTSHSCLPCLREPPPWSRLFAVADYAEPVNRVIGAFKHASLDWLAKPLAQRCWQSFADELQEFDALVPVPLHFWRQRRRGFNQSELLAKELAARLALPVIQPLRRRRGPALSTLTHDQRRAWAHRTLDLRRPRRWKVGQRNSLPNKLLLVDDVLTTGATARRACELLQRAGARSVAVLAFARTP